MSCQATSETKTQRSTHMIVSFETIMHQQVMMHQEVSTQQHQQQINATVPPANDQNESDDVSPFIQEHTRQIIVNRDIKVDFLFVQFKLHFFESMVICA
eukprot:14549001-Ditylum_brightwellii.AAC.1